jgi:hypothetical protein
VLTDATGTTNGSPYIRFLNSGKTLKKGASLTITLRFTAPSRSDITFDAALADVPASLRGPAEPTLARRGQPGTGVWRAFRS